MTEQRCTCCDLPVEWCGNRPLPPAPAAPPFEQPIGHRPPGRSFTAMYPGTCACGQRIEPGDQLRYDEDDDLVLVGCCG